MSKDRNTIPPQIIDEASEWFVTMREPNTSAEDREAFAEWLRASPAHVGAYLEIARLWTDASHIDRDLAANVDLSDALPPNVIALPTDGAGHDNRDNSRITRRRGTPERDDLNTLHPVLHFFKAPRRLTIVFAASLLLAVIAGGTWLYANRVPTYVTDIGEQRTITLDDGSVVRLNSRSEFKVRMSPKLRQIELVAGQALFEVAHDANRPFIVTSGNSAVRAVGTQFDVNRKRSGTTVTVIEGRVRLDPIPPSALDVLFGFAKPAPSVTPNDASNAANDASGTADPALPKGSGFQTVAPDRSSSPRETYLAAGEQMRVDPTGAMERTAKPNTAAAISWLQQELIFEGQSLADVVEEFNRYTRTPIVLNDVSLGDLRINAVFQTTSPDSLLRFISRYDNVRIDRDGDQIRISRRE